MRITDYFYTPKDIINALRIRHAVGVVAAFFIITGLHYIGAGTDAALFAASIVATQIWKMDPRVPFVGAIGCFIAIMVASVLNSQTVSTEGTIKERLAVAAFYFLVLGVLLLLREHIKPPKQKPYITDIPRQEYELDELVETLPESKTTQLPKKTYTPYAPHKHAQNQHVLNSQHSSHTAAPAYASPSTLEPKPLPHLQPQLVASRLKHAPPVHLEAPAQAPLQAPAALQQEPSKPVPLAHLQRSPYLLDLRGPQKPKQHVAQQHKKSISDVAPPKGFTAKRHTPRGPIQL